MIATALYCGLRKGELFGLRWIDLALDAGRIDVNRSYKGLPKSGKARHLPLNPELTVILRTWREQCPPTEDGFVFPVEAAPGRFRMGAKEDGLRLNELLRDAKCHVPAKPWHALRHTFASHFIMAGGNILTLQRLLGHADLKMTQRYAHLAPGFMAAEVARMTFAAPRPADVADLGDERRRRMADAESPTGTLGPQMGQGGNRDDVPPTRDNEKGEGIPAFMTVEPRGIEPLTSRVRF